jgi:hypothetical protein
MYHIISPDSNIMEPPILGDKLGIFVSESFDTLDEMMKMINKFYWFERYEHYDKFYDDEDFYDTEEETKEKEREKIIMEKFMEKCNTDLLISEEQYFNEIIKDMLDENNLYDPKDYIKEPEYQFVHKFYKRDKEEYINNIFNELKSIEKGTDFFKVYNKLGLNIDSDPLVIAITKDIVVIDNHIIYSYIDEDGKHKTKSKCNYIKATKEQFYSMSN